jgi:hypothetical protein
VKVTAYQNNSQGSGGNRDDNAGEHKRLGHRIGATAVLRQAYQHQEHPRAYQVEGQQAP